MNKYAFPPYMKRQIVLIVWILSFPVKHLPSHGRRLTQPRRSAWIYVAEFFYVNVCKLLPVKSLVYKDTLMNAVMINSLYKIFYNFEFSGLISGVITELVV